MLKDVHITNKYVPIASIIIDRQGAVSILNWNTAWPGDLCCNKAFSGVKLQILQ